MASSISAIARRWASVGSNGSVAAKPIGERGLPAVCGTPRLLGLHPMLAERDAQLQREQLVELQPLLRAGELAASSSGKWIFRSACVVVAEAPRPRPARRAAGRGSSGAARSAGSTSSRIVRVVMPSDAGCTGVMRARVDQVGVVARARSSTSWFASWVRPRYSVTTPETATSCPSL